ncbi:MAG TPA: VWA domain-containing protein [Acidobacteriota bacterium]|nr:VWA domain-containing protein [Acidobacteriota bacterium]
MLINLFCQEGTPMRMAVLWLLMLAAVVLSPLAWAQSGRVNESGTRSYSINAILQPIPDESGLPPLKGVESADPIPIPKNQVAVYEAGIEQEIQGFRSDVSGARYVLLVDNSQNVQAQTADMERATRAIAKEIFVGDQVMVVGYNESPEIIEDFTDDGKKLVEAGKLFAKRKPPRLFDALAAVVEDALRSQISTSKRVILLFSDGYDSGSQYTYDQTLELLQTENIVVYVLQCSDRTFGAPRAKKLGPKPTIVAKELAEGTGGRVFSMEESLAAMKIITDEVRNRWYVLSYAPKGVNLTISRRLLLSLNDNKYSLRTKQQQPAGH